MTHQKDSSGHCCPEFNTVPWQEKTHVWKDKPFIKGSIPAFFHLPWPPMVGKLVEKMWKMAREASAAPEMKDFLLLAYDPTPFKSEFYLTVTKAVPGADNVKLSGTFISKVFDGPYNAVPQWIKEMDEFLKTQNQSAKKYYFYFTYCPKCAKSYGHNYGVAFAQVS
ncbi:MAG: hydrolase [bacterium]